MKQVDKVIRKGDYYEMEVVDDGLFSIKPHKKEEVQSTIQINSDNIVTELPEYKEARSKYYYQIKNQYASAEADELMYELETLVGDEKLADEDKEQILKLIKEIQILKEESLVPLIDLSPANKIKEKQPIKIGDVELKIMIDLKTIEDKVTKLEKFRYPELTSLQHQLQVLLGEKKVAPHSQFPKDDRNKEEIDQLFGILSSLNCAENISGVVDKIHANSTKYSQMAHWVQQIEETSSFHLDFLAELNEDELLLNKLETNFKANVETVKQTIAKLKAEAKK